MADDTGIQPCDPSLKPSAAWIHEFLRQFAQLRRRLQREYELTSGQAAAAPPGTHRLLLSQAALEAAAAEELAALQLDPPSAAMPELQQLRGLDQVQVRRQLHAAIQSAVQQEALAPEAAASLYALSARMDKPLPAGTSALYRDLLRCCAAQRAALGADGGGAAAAHPRLPHLNILIAVVGAYFGQDEELAGMWEGDEE
ncbi:Gem-associated 2 [Micractinium conductrix]|uniref:Gem-associated 2 n=1 Tax=Micractinium conductrix TaxID=554055 RepID=A0A2P6V1Y7_9CHLO|nr:Gem-associated 2 [Micractinium conductrix]|eukprot:PSC68095.1 Gem-associated 2 [Micractinium conductrix]